MYPLFTTAHCNTPSFDELEGRGKDHKYLFSSTSVAFVSYLISKKFHLSSANFRCVSSRLLLESITNKTINIVEVIINETKYFVYILLVFAFSVEESNGIDGIKKDCVTSDNEERGDDEDDDDEEDSVRRKISPYQARFYVIRYDEK
jgi:hypothetical protein